ncbi:hypothetical protein L7F22_027442 [Adiantum nelumboides]|nr:hypothetical protein [Adiantum nelumboides]
MASTASPDYADYPFYDEYSQHQDLRPLNRLKVAVIVLFLCITFLFLALYFYGKWQLRRSLNRRNANINALLEPTSKGGLSKDAIALLPTFIYRVTSISDEATGNSSENTGFLHCAICLTEFQHNEQELSLCLPWPSVPLHLHIPTAASSTHKQQEPGAEEEAATEHENQNSINAPSSPHNSDTIVPQRCSAAAIGPQDLECENATQVPSSFSDGVVTIRCLPHITIQIPTREESFKLTALAASLY